MAQNNDPWAKFRTGGAATSAPVSPPEVGEGVFIAAPGAAERTQREREAADRAAEQLRLSQESGDRAEKTEKRQTFFDVQDRYRNDRAVVKYEGALPNYVAALQTSPSEDLTLLYLYAKTIDPQSTVGASDMENINASDARLPAAVQTALRELRASDGKFTDAARDNIRSGLHRVISQYNIAYKDARDRAASNAKLFGLNPDQVIGKHAGDSSYDTIQTYWQRQYQKNPASVPPEYRPEQPAATGGGQEGPTVSVTPEESIEAFGEFTGGKPGYDAQGNIVGYRYAEAGNQVYDERGNPIEVGVFGRVTDETIQEPAPSFITGLIRGGIESVTGSERATATTEALPDWVEMPELQQLFSIPSFKANLGTLFGGGPQEIAQIVQSNFPGTKVFQDAKGNYILQSPSTGKQYAIKPGFQVSDVPRLIGTILLGSEGIGARGAMGVAGREALMQTGIEGTQAITGGTFNPEDIAMAGVGGGVLQKAGEVLPYAAGRMVGNMRRGTAPTPVIPQGIPELPGGLTRPGGGADEYISRINPEARRIAPEDRPNLGLGDMYGMAPRDARQIAAMDVPELGQIRFVEKDGNIYALGYNPDIGEMDTIGYAILRGNETELAVVNEFQGRGIGTELAYQFRSRNPSAPSGGLTEAGERTVRRAYERMEQPPAGGGVTHPPAPMAPASPSMAPVAPAGAAGEITTAPRVFEAGETVTSRAGGAMGTSPETVRVQRAGDLPVPVNLAKFQRTRAFEDMQRARELAKNNEVGGPIRERLAQQQQQIAANFDSFLERTGSEIWGNLEDQGVAVSDALRKMAARDKTRITALYKKAKNSEEAQAKVPLAEAVEINVDGEPYVGSLIDYLNSQPTGVPSSAVSDTARQFAVNLGIATRGPDGQLIAANPTVGNLEGFRREMSGIAGDATGRRQEKIIKDLVDAHTEPYAGNLYREARAARRNYAERYENMSLISNLIGTKKNSPESVIAAEKVVDRILSASTDLQNLRQLRDILQSDNAGQQAWREIQGAAIESLRGKAYPNGAVRDEAGNQVIAPAAFAKEVGRLDKAGKLDVIFDNKTANHLRTLADVTQDVFTAPPGSVNFTNSSSGWLNAADAVFNTIVAQIPLPDGAFSRILGPASKYIFKAKERKTLKKEVRELLD